jgi:broad specificity phosphatase PhoE
MKIYLLRHEQRYDNRGFDTDLTKEGFKNAEKISTTLEKLDIDYIFVSPYKRVMQTIEPYLKKNDQKVNPEYGIYESLHLDDSDINIRHINEELYGYQYMNKYYKCCVDKSNLNPGETYTDIIRRTQIFMKKLMSNKDLSNKNILIVCHLSIINGILDRSENSTFNMGKLVLFYNNGYLTNDI